MVRIVNQNDRYGLDNCLTHNQAEPLVEFYDARYPFTAYGQFVSRYYMTTLLDRSEAYGLDLDGGIRDWKIDRNTMASVMNWLREQV